MPEICLDRTGTLVAAGAGPCYEVDSGSVRYDPTGAIAEIRDGVALEWQPLSGDSRGWVQLIDMRGAAPTVLGKYVSSQSLVNGVAWSPSGKRVAVRPRFGETIILDETLVEQARLPLTMETLGVGLLEFVGEEHLLSPTDRALELWSLPRRTRQLTLPLQPYPLFAAVAEDSSRVLVMGSNEASLHSLTSENSTVLAGHQSYASSVAYAPDGRQLVTAGWDGRVYLWDSSTGERLAFFEVPELPGARPPRAARGLAFSPDGKHVIVVGHDERTIYTWDPGTGQAQVTARCPSLMEHYAEFLEQSQSGARAWAHSPGQRCAGAFDRSLWAHGSLEGDYLSVQAFGGDGELYQLSGDPGGTLALAFDRTSSLLAAGSRVGGIRLWDLPGRTVRAELTGHRGEIFSLSFSPDGRRLASGGRDGRLRIWDLESSELIATIPGHSNYIHSVTFRPDGKQIATASGDHTVRLWEAPGMP